MQRKFTMTFHTAGTYASAEAITFTLPSAAQLVHVSVVSSDDSAATLSIGNSDDADEYLATAAIDQNTPAEYDGDDFLDADGNTHDCYYPHIAADTVVCIITDGTSVDDLTIVLTFVEG